MQWSSWPGANGDKALTANPDAVSFLMDAFRHLKAIGLAGVPHLAKRAHVGSEAGVADVGRASGVNAFIEFAKSGRVWDRDTE